jgi:GT2 family glycosyltransferase
MGRSADTRTTSDARSSDGRSAARDDAAPELPLLVVLVNYRTPDVTIDCLRSLAPEIEDAPGARVVVVDNRSDDGSAERLSRAVADSGWADWARVVEAPRNGGFAYGNNRGIEAGGPARHVLLLNSDTVVHRGCLRHCMGVMESDPTIGAMSCKLLNADGSLQVAGRRFPSPSRITLAATGLPWRFPRLLGWGQGEYRSWDQSKQGGDADWLGGAFLWVRGDVMRRLGGLDETFFFYGEDVEFCHRVRRAGFRCRYDPGASITHLGGASSDPSRLDAGERSVHAWNGRYLVQRRCYGRLAERWARLIDLGICRFRLLRMRLSGRGDEKRRAELRARIDVIRERRGDSR